MRPPEMREPDSYPAIPFSKARLDGSSVHETRPGLDSRVPVLSVAYLPDGSTEIAWADGLKTISTGYGSRARTAVIA